MPRKGVIPILIEDKMWCCPKCYNNLLHKWIKYPFIKTPLSWGLSECKSCGAKLNWDALRGGERA